MITWSNGDISNSQSLTDSDHLYPEHINELRTAVSGLSTTFNVKNYGAVGDNSTDDTSSIQATVDACKTAGGGTVFLPYGTYCISSAINIDGSVSIKFTGDYGTIIKNNNTSGGHTISIGTGATLLTAFIEISNLFIHGNTSSGDGIYINKANNIIIDRCSIWKHGGSGITGKDTYTMRVRYSQVVDCSGFGIALYSAGGNNTQIICCKINDNHGNNKAGIYVADSYNITIWGCDFEANYYGILGYTTSNINIKNNYFEVNTSAATWIQDCYNINFMGNSVFNTWIELTNCNDSEISGNLMTGSDDSDIIVSGTSTNVIVGPNTYADADGKPPTPSAMVEMISTTKGFAPPRMTGTQRDAISAPAEGLVIYNTSTHKLNVRTASAWEAVTSS